MSERNVELLLQTMTHILDHPESHRQSAWVTVNECGTAGCFAGWACLLSPEWEQVQPYSELYGDHFVPRGTRGTPKAKMNVAKESFDLAIELLGITDAEANKLFDAVNTRPVLELMVKDLCNGEELRSQSHYFWQAEQCAPSWVSRA